MNIIIIHLISAHYVVFHFLSAPLQRGFLNANECVNNNNVEKKCYKIKNNIF